MLSLQVVVRSTLLLYFILAPLWVNASLVGYWDFPSAVKLGQDESGRGNTLAVSGDGVAYTASGRVGGALSLTGNGYLASATSITGLPVGNSSYTVAAWMKTTATNSNTARGLVGWGNYGATRQVNALRINGANGLSHYWWNADLLASDSQVSAAGVTLSNQWAHVAVTFDGATRSIYLNGSLLTSDTPGVNGSLNQNFALGRTAGNEYFRGALDEVAVWDAALPAAQIAALASGAATPLNGPQIISFAAGTNPVYENANVPLSWTVDGAKDAGALTVTLTQNGTTLYSGSAASGSVNVTIPAFNAAAQTFIYTLTATDAGSKASASSTLTLEALRDVPTAAPQSGLTVTASNTLPITLTGNDPGGAPLTYSVVGQPAHGTLSAVSDAPAPTPPQPGTWEWTVSASRPPTQNSTPLPPSSRCP